MALGGSDSGRPPGADGGALAGADSGAGAGALLAVGPTGLVLVPPGPARVSEGARGLARGGSDSSARWTGTVVRSTFRRGRTEVTVDVDLGAGTQRVVALGTSPGRARSSTVRPPDGAAHHPLAPAPGEQVDVELDRAGCAVVPG